MKRKLSFIALCVFALLLLMGAGNEPDLVPALVNEEESVSAAGETLETGELTGVDQSEDALRLEEDPSEPSGEEADAAVPAAAAEEEPVPAVDAALLVDGDPVPAETGRTLDNGVTYVALAPMVRAVLSEANISWDEEDHTVSVEAPNLTLTAREGELYVVANGRYLYIPETVQLRDGRVIVPLKVLAKALDARLDWDDATGVVTVTRGSGAIEPGESFYDQNDLFWMSRLITRESGNQSLKGMMAVGNVLLNRIKSPAFPDTLEGVLSQKNQFTTYASGALGKAAPGERCVIAAKLVLDGAEVEETQGALYFDSAANSWASRNKAYVATLGSHRFFK